MSAAPRRTVVIGPPPTPNGDLHVGHLAGPYLAADIYSRYLRAAEQPVLYVTGTDDSQTYVVASAARAGVDPQTLAARSSEQIKASLDAAGIAVDGYAPFDDGYRSTVLEFVTRLHDAGRLRLRTVDLPWSERTQSHLVEGLVRGGCRVCLAESRGGLCESCGHPNNFAELTDPGSTVDADDVVTTRPATIMVLPLEEYRAELETYYATRRSAWRPHIVQLVGELLSRPLPDFPVTYPLSWGIPAPFPQTPGQVINAWVEGMPASMYCTAVGQRRHGEDPATNDELWLAEHDVRLVYFLGFDNAYFWGITHLALLLAHEGRYVLPDTIVCNEFYELEHDKFSTSKGHVVWARDLLQEVPRDVVRFYLALTAPENARTNFSSAALHQVTRDRLTEPWAALATSLAKSSTELPSRTAALPVPRAAHDRVVAMLDRFAGCYALETFSLTRAADLVVEHTARLRASAQAGSDAAGMLPPDERAERVAGLLAEVRALVVAASPLLVDVADAVRRADAFDVTLASALSREVRPFDLPLVGAGPDERAVPCTSS